MRDRLVVWFAAVMSVVSVIGLIVLFLTSLYNNRFTHDEAKSCHCYTYEEAVGIFDGTMERRNDACYGTNKCPSLTELVNTKGMENW